MKRTEKFKFCAKFEEKVRSDVSRIKIRRTSLATFDEKIRQNKILTLKVGILRKFLGKDEK